MGSAPVEKGRVTMPDREKVIKGLQECDLNGGMVGNCPYKDAIFALLKEQEDLGTELTNAVELIHKKNERIEKLLKEQEPVEPYVTGNGESFETAETWWYECGNCNKPIDPIDKFCRHCGRPVKWG